MPPARTPPLGRGCRGPSRSNAARDSLAAPPPAGHRETVDLEAHEAVAVVEGQLGQGDGFEEGEAQGRRGDADGEGEDHRQAEKGALAQAAQALGQVADGQREQGGKRGRRGHGASRLGAVGGRARRPRGWLRFHLRSPAPGCSMSRWRRALYSPERSACSRASARGATQASSSWSRRAPGTAAARCRASTAASRKRGPRRERAMPSQ